MKDVELAVWQHRQLLNHCSAKKLDSGWVVLADRNYFDAVLLVSQHRPILRSFVHGEPYHSFLRAQIGAEVHAENNPESAPPVTAGDLVVKALAA